MKPLIRSLALPCAFLIGFLIPSAHVLSPVIPWFVRFMIFMIVLQCRVSQFKIRWNHLRVFLLNIFIPIAICQIFFFFDYREFGLIAFFTAITPTGTAAPAVMGFLKGNVEFVFTSFLINTLGVAAVMPFLIPQILHSSTPGLFTDVAGQMLSVVLAPFLLAVLLRFIVPGSSKWPAYCRQIVFFSWVVVVGIICSCASHYIHTTADLSWSVLIEVGALTALICFLNFFLGYLAGEKKFKRESSQSLGQKNTSLTIHLALLYANPLIALGPTLYVIWHNLWNAWQLHKSSQKEEAESQKSEIQSEAQIEQ